MSGGGSMVNLLAIWRAHGLDEILRECWQQGILICGQSAGRDGAGSRAGSRAPQGKPAVADGLGLLPGSACVHYLTEPVRRRRFLRAIAAQELEPGLGLEDQTGAIFEDAKLVETICAREGAEVWEASLEGRAVVETGLHSRRLEDGRAPINDMRAEIRELRQTLATRARHRRRAARRPRRR